MKNIDECIAEIDTLIGALKNEKKEKCKLLKCWECYQECLFP